MKKIICFALALVMIASLSVTAFADDTNNGSADTEISVSGVYHSSESGNKGENISVDVIWDGGFCFSYYPASEEWNPDDHSYGEGEEAYWDIDHKGEIILKNHSDCAVTVTYEFEAEYGENVTGTFYTLTGEDEYTAIASNSQSAELGSAVGTTRDDEDATLDESPKTAIYFAITGGSIDQDYTNLGTITITVAKASAE